MLKLVGGTAFAHGVAFLAVPVIARLFAPEAFGLAAVFISMSAVASSLACLCYESSIVLPESDEEAANLLGVCVCAAVLTSLAVAMVVYLAGEGISSLFGVSALYHYLWILPAAVMINGLLISFSSWNTRGKRFGMLSLVRVVSSVFNNGGKIGVGLAGWTGGGALIGAGVFSKFVGLVALCAGTLATDGRFLWKNIRPKGILAGFKRRRNFALFSTWAILFNRVSFITPIWILGYFFTPAEVGFFAFTRTMATAPLTIVGESFARVFYQKAAEIRQRGRELGSTVETVLRGVCAVCLFPTLMLMLIGEEIFVVLFGETWAEAGVFLQILGPWLFAGFIYLPMNNLFNVLEKQRAHLLFNTVLLAARAVTLLGAGMFGSARTVVFFFSASSLVVISWAVFWICGRCGASKKACVGHFFRYCAYSSPLLGLLAFIKCSVEAEPLVVFCAGVLAVAVYFGCIAGAEKTLKAMLPGIIKLNRNSKERKK